MSILGIKYVELSVRDKKFMKRVLRHVIGLTFIVLGIIGCFLPVLQGILFLIIGIIVLSPEVPAVQKMLSILERKYPEIFRKAKSLIKHKTDKKIIDEK